MDLALASDGVTPYGWARIDDGAGRDFFIRYGDVEDVVSRLGPSEKLGEYPGGSGGVVGFWRPSADEADYLGFQFGPWAVLVYDYRTDAQARLSEESRALWASHLRGATNSEGFLLLSSDYPLLLGRAGEYPSPMSLTLWSPDGLVSLTPEPCQPGFVSDSKIDNDDYAQWCDVSGHMSIAASGPPEFQQKVYDGLLIGHVSTPGVPAPDSRGSYEELSKALEQAETKWETNRPVSYTLHAKGNLGMRLVNAHLRVEGSSAMVIASNGNVVGLRVEDLFSLIANAISNSDEFVSAQFHPSLGYPMFLGGDASSGFDDEWGLRIVLEPIDPSPGVRWINEPLCEFPPGSALGGFGMEEGRQAIPDYQAWIRAPDAAAALGRVADVVGESDLTFGWLRDHVQRHLVVGVDPTKGQVVDLVSQLRDAAGDALSVVVRPGCYSMEELEPVITAMYEKDWHPEPRVQSWHLGVTGRIIVGLTAPADEQAQILKDLFGGKVEIRILDPPS
ncbi:MAG: DUF6174 domain-containing protein [Acidimicrobiia bacterium]|nr:DUF6174 domain-containing protein [Acidimicrobiia bacterium]